LKKGQVRGASTGLFGGMFSNAKKDESGELDTTAAMGTFKGLISVTRKANE